jgi:hypothetical protein
VRLGGAGRGIRFCDAQVRRIAARRPTVHRWPRAARRDKQQNEILDCNLDAIRDEMQVPTVSSAHSVALVAVVEGAFGNDFDLVP